jgi:hypothetical protein
VSSSLVFITQQAAGPKMNSKQLTGSILSCFVFVTVVVKCKKIMLVPGKLIGKTGLVLFLVIKKKNILVVTVGEVWEVGLGRVWRFEFSTLNWISR